MRSLTRHGCALLLPFTVLLVGIAVPCSAKEKSGRKLTLLERRPCGPDAIKGPLRYLFFQGCAGADFRPACIRHDLSYDTLGADKEACDRQLLYDMLEESKKSKLPWFARYRAHLGYLGVHLIGNSAWDSAQEIARRKAYGDEPEAAPPAPRPFARWFRAKPGTRPSDSRAASNTK